MDEDFAVQIKKHLMKIIAEWCKRAEEQWPWAVWTSLKIMIHLEFKLASGFVVWLGHNEKRVDGVVRNVAGEITSDQILFVSLFKEFGFFLRK